MTALEDINQAFHDHYGAAREQAREAAPVLVVLADTLALHRGSQREALEFTPELFHAIKAVVHAPIAAFAGGGAALLERLRAIQLAGTDEVTARLRALVADTVRFLETDRPDRAAFARQLGPRLLQSTDDATRIQLDALDRASQQLLSQLDAAERAALQVVVAGAHQARARSLGMQYFGKLLGDADRLVYAESIETEAEAVRLVATKRIDRTIASAFFGEPTRLERDILGDSVAAQLAEFEPRAFTK